MRRPCGGDEERWNRAFVQGRPEACQVSSPQSESKLAGFVAHGGGFCAVPLAGCLGLPVGRGSCCAAPGLDGSLWRGLIPWSREQEPPLLTVVMFVTGPRDSVRLLTLILAGRGG